jgi:hypothetical protein
MSTQTFTDREIRQNAAIQKLTDCAQVFTTWTNAVELMNWLKENDVLPQSTDVEKEAYEYVIRYASEHAKTTFRQVIGTK